MPKVALYRSEAWRSSSADDVRRVLILRSCRAEVFASAVQATRERYPAACISALSHRGHTDSLRAAGADRIVEIGGRQFGLLHIRPWTLARLRAQRFDVVVIPQMTSDLEGHANLYRLAAALGAGRVVVAAADDEPLAFDAGAFRHFALWSSCSKKWDAIVLLAMLLAACCRRRVPLPATDGRRRVLCIVSHLGVGGAQVQLMELLNRMPAEQYDVDLLVLSATDCAFSRRALVRTDVEVAYLDQWPRLSHSVRELMIRCQTRQYDVVHTWLFLANVLGAAAARLAGVPLVIASVRNLSVWKRESWYREWWHRAADMLASHAADVVTVNAHALVADHARWAWMRKRRIEVIHNGLDPARLAFDRAEGRALLRQATGATASARFVGTVGRLAHEKDQATFLRMLGRVRRVRPDVHGVLIGDGSLRPSLEKLAVELGLIGAVSFLGERADARALVAGFDLFLLSSRSEGFPNVLLEATFMSIPCVATDIAGNPDVLDDKASLFAPGDVDAGAARVLAALGDGPMTLRRTAAVRRRALELFTAERSVGAWLDLYRRHIERRTRPQAQLSAAGVLHMPEAR